MKLKAVVLTLMIAMITRAFAQLPVQFPGTLELGLEAAAKVFSQPQK